MKLPFNQLLRDMSKGMPKLIAAQAFSRALTTTLVIGLMAATVAASTQDSPEALPEITTKETPKANVLQAEVSIPAPLARYKTVEHTIRQGETASEALTAMHAPTEALLKAAGTSLNRVGVGDVLALDYVSGEKKPFRLRFSNGGSVIRAIEWTGSEYQARIYPIPYTVEPLAISLQIESSLWAAGEAAGLSPAQIMSLARIFETEVDFNTELVEGAVFRLVADKLTDEQGKVRYSAIRGARLINGNKSWSFIRFTSKDGKTDWYAPDGEGRKRPFLRSPLEFSRVTSGFSKGRYHPLLKEKRPHYGVDLGAPTGTPIRAVADGVVVVSGRHGGHGNYVEVKHSGPYGTSYSHLSAILVRKGQKVKQGDVIGRVGSTGLSTGPHLHYQMTINGKYVDPMKTVLPMTGGLSVEDKAAFHQVRDEIMVLLNQK
jgi:murein DD-endopeptidase MepM/ murein hydrolase activator NlpD